MKNIILIFIALTSILQDTAKQLTSILNEALKKANIEDYLGAIADYTKAIEIDPFNAFYYCYRGDSKFGLYNYIDAIAD